MEKCQVPILQIPNNIIIQCLQIQDDNHDHDHHDHHDHDHHQDHQDHRHDHCQIADGLRGRWWRDATITEIDLANQFPSYETLSFYQCYHHHICYILYVLIIVCCSHI